MNASEICYCTHFLDQHEENKRVWSKAMQDMVYVSKCKIPGCRCHHFKKTTFVPKLKEFEVAEKKKSEEV